MAKAKRPSSTKRIRKEVKLDPVTPEFAEAAIATIENLCEEYGISPRDKDVLWA